MPSAADGEQSRFSGATQSIGSILEKFYVIPEYQREYAWAPGHVKALLRDISEAIDFENPSQSKPYFLGGIVVAPRTDNRWDVIDGQQRLTTLFIALCAIRDFLRDADEAAKADAIRGRIRNTRTDNSGHDQDEFRLELQYADSHGILEIIGADRPGKLLDTEQISRPSASVDFLLAAYDTCIDFAKTELQGDEDKCRQLFAHLDQRTFMVRIKAGTLTQAFQVFETLNDRGVGLTPADLLKNLLFMEAEEADYPAIHSTWKTAFDRLYIYNEKPKRVLRYFVLSDLNFPMGSNKVTENVSEDRVYRWLRDRRDDKAVGISKSPLKFARKLDDFSMAYENLLQGRDSKGTPCQELLDIQALMRLGTQHLIPLLAARNFSPPAFSKLAREIENLLFAHIVTGTVLRSLEAHVIKWAPMLREMGDPSDAELGAFFTKYFDPIKKDLSYKFVAALANLRLSSLPKYRSKYVLARLAHFVQQQAVGEAAGVLTDYIDKQYDMEHIHPQDSAISWWEFLDDDEREKQLESLGNLVLLERPLNRSAGNNAFADKRTHYDSSQLHVVRVLGGVEPPPGEHQVARAYRELNLNDPKEWSASSLRTRLKWSVKVGCKAWNIPYTNDPLEEG